MVVHTKVQETQAPEAHFWHGAFSWVTCNAFLSPRNGDRVSGHSPGSDPLARDAAVEMAVHWKHAEMSPPCLRNPCSEVRLPRSLSLQKLGMLRAGPNVGPCTRKGKHRVQGPAAMQEDRFSVPGAAMPGECPNLPLIALFSNVWQHLALQDFLCPVLRYFLWASDAFIWTLGEFSTHFYPKASHRSPCYRECYSSLAVFTTVTINGEWQEKQIKGCFLQ